MTRCYRGHFEQPVTALDGVDLTVPPGTRLALWGPSGSGKSTLLQLIGALDRPDTGEIQVDDQRLGDL